MSHINALSTPNRYITGHDYGTGKSIFLNDSVGIAAKNEQYGVGRDSSDRSAPKAKGKDISDRAPASAGLPWVSLGGLPGRLGGNADVNAYKETLGQMSTLPVPLVVEGGTSVHYIELSPGMTSAMHQTVSIDIDVMIEGEVELHLDSGEMRTLRKGDCIVQRGTMHAWKNTSKTVWVRFLAVCQPIEPLEIAGKKLGLEFNEVPKL